MVFFYGYELLSFLRSCVDGYFKTGNMEQRKKENFNMLLYEKINKLIEKKLNMCYNKVVIIATRYTKRECPQHSLF